MAGRMAHFVWENPPVAFDNTRLFGVEIELYQTCGADELAYYLTEEGIQTYDEDYNHCTRDYWKIVPDGSLSADDGSPDCDDCEEGEPPCWDCSEYPECISHCSEEPDCSSCERREDDPDWECSDEDRDVCLMSLREYGNFGSRCRECVDLWREYGVCDDCRYEARQEACRYCEGTPGGRRGRTGGCELVTPPLSGEEGFAQIEVACRVLNNLGCTVDASTGLHVHHDASDLTIFDWRKLFIDYATYEWAIDSFMPGSRRRDNNGYCSSLAGRYYSVSELAKHAHRCNSVRQLCNRFARSGKLNPHAWVQHGTVEFRHHSGTINYEKIRNWVIFTQAMVSRSKEGSAFLRPNLTTESLDKTFTDLRIPPNVADFYYDRARELG